VSELGRSSSTSSGAASGNSTGRSGATSGCGEVSCCTGEVSDPAQPFPSARQEANNTTAKMRNDVMASSLEYDSRPTARFTQEFRRNRSS
jgi:hypothetical protein